MVGAARAVYEAAASLALRLLEDDDARAVEVRGLAVVLPAETPGGSDPRPASLSSLNIQPRNLLHLLVQPNGFVDVKRGASLQIQTVGPEHIEGMKSSATIIAVNTDENAPIFNFAHYGMTADLFDVCEELTEALEDR